MQRQDRPLKTTLCCDRLYQKLGSKKRFVYPKYDRTIGRAINSFFKIGFKYLRDASTFGKIFDESDSGIHEKF